MPDCLAGYLCSEIIEPAYSERRPTRAIDKYAFQLSALLKTEAAQSRKQRRTLKQIHEDLKELDSRGLTTGSRRSREPGGRVKLRGAIRPANEHAEEKAALVRETYEPGMSVSLVARKHGVGASQLFNWHKLEREGALTPITAGESVVPSSELAAARAGRPAALDAIADFFAIGQNQVESRPPPCV